MSQQWERNIPLEKYRYSSGYRRGTDSSQKQSPKYSSGSEQDSPTRKQKLKESVGVACVRYLNGFPEILLVRKRFTYSYCVFVNGRYNSSDNENLIRLFSGMTLEEKINILSLNFDQIWYGIWFNRHDRDFKHAKSIFDRIFVRDEGARLKRLIAKSKNDELIWEIPKGRHDNKTESDINCATREFEEETGINKSKYKLWIDGTKSHSYVDGDVRYSNTYFIAYTRNKLDVNVNFNNIEQLKEVSAIKWMGLADIKLIDKSGRLAKFVKPIFNYVKKRKLE